MRIERYAPEYEQDIHRLIKEFHSESLSEYGISFNDQALSDTIEQTKDQAFLLIIDGKAQGVLAGKEVKSPHSADKVWHEIVWFVSAPYRKYGIKLLEAGKAMLKVEGFNKIVMGYMHNSKSDKLHRLYIRLGYQPMETSYIGGL